MYRLTLLGSALGVALLASPAPAQRDTVGEMQRERGNPAVPSVPLQNRDAAQADRVTNAEPTGWLRQAQDMLRRNRPGEANELVERAETRLLTRSTPAPLAGQPSDSPAVGHISLARGAIQNRDRTAALMHIDRAVTALGGVPADRTTGAPAGNRPNSGGGSMMRDRGASLDDRSGRIILAQSGGSGGLSGSSPGSPGAGQAPGSTPSTTSGSTQQPAQGSASPGVGARTGTGVGAPPPGSGGIPGPVGGTSPSTAPAGATGGQTR